ncbi:Abhydrolase-4 domain-containing protein [Mycena indigotica]|uniref:Abhydrolase-4 domain-containing protein n=1 Tax=Mycena indigotica TaxID=2126181 RepID=A0A8H6W456_9AGAR|nr:Abhydrolase-4 domain-containing protein [Mycena indigotica]KAF7301068.1 Abhydrolase-4 domain-containing protein [Mycena indigotica]
MGLGIRGAIVLALGLGKWSDAHACKSTTAETDVFSWENIQPSEDLVWIKCYGDKHCARLEVPLDYSNPNSGSAAIAMVRLHSGISHEDPQYHGPILINPGGPGGSGVDFALSWGSKIHTVVGPEFDIIGFDPRGIARSTPRASFFSSRAERAIFNSGGGLSPNASADTLSRIWAQGTLLGELASANDDGNLKFINTDNTARDMLRIVQKHGSDKLLYWGFSYGSVLGATFAAMFPDNVGRLIIDGVVDSEDYYATKWSNSLKDTDKVLSLFAAGCVKAGQTGCPFYASSAEQILANIDSLALALRSKPIPVRASLSHGLIDFSLFRATVFKALYSPYAQFRPLAQALAELTNGNASAFWELSALSRGDTPFQCGCNPSEYLFESLAESRWAVLCNDGARIPSDYDAWETYYLALSKTSSFADQWTIARMGCLAWPEFPKTNFRGPFVANTSFPLLLIGNTADPVTPLWSARKMSQGFGGSVVLTQNSAGHCSLSGPSICTQKAVRAYFVDGELPKGGTICPVDSQPFDKPALGGDDANQAVFRVVEDQLLYNNARELAMSFQTLLTYNSNHDCVNAENVPSTVTLDITASINSLFFLLPPPS